MKGKVMIQAQAKFPNLKRNSKFQEWLSGSKIAPLRPKISAMCPNYWALAGSQQDFSSMLWPATIWPRTSNIR